MDFVSFDIAKKLKEKGFDEECFAYYTSEYTLYTNKVAFCDDKYFNLAEIGYEECLYSYNTQKDRLLEHIVDAPTISQVLKWLREEKEIDIVINPIFKYDDNLNGIREYGVSVFAPSLNKPTHCGYFNMWEKASIAGIEYALDNLI